jgi:hypothetical protein
VLLLASNVHGSEHSIFQFRYEPEGETARVTL